LERIFIAQQEGEDRYIGYNVKREFERRGRGPVGLGERNEGYFGERCLYGLK